MKFEKLSDCIEYYQQYHLTKHKYHNRASHLRYFDVYSLSDLKKVHIRQYQQKRLKTVKNATINREISFARASINAVNRDFELQTRNPFADIKFICFFLLSLVILTRFFYIKNAFKCF